MKICGQEIRLDELHHGQKVVIPLMDRGVKKKIAYKVISLEASKLFTDFLAYKRLCDLLHDDCCNKPNFRDWTCCHAHRSLSGELRQLQARAEKILPNEGGLWILGPGWWKKLGFNVSHFSIIIP